MREVGVERDRVAGLEAVLVTRDVKGDSALGDDGGLAAAGLVHGRIAGTAGTGVRLQGVERHLGALPGKRRGGGLVALLLRAAPTAIAPAPDAHPPSPLPAGGPGQAPL